MTIHYFDVLIIGAGISGISAAYYVKNECPNKTFAILEGGTTLGGTWNLFKYPGIRSDSDMYTLGFKFEPWTNAQSIADAPAIMEYLNHTVDKHNLRSKIQYNCFVKKAEWLSEKAVWRLEVYNNSTSEAEAVIYECRFLSMCAGYYNYNSGYTPQFEGVKQFKGVIVHPQAWDSSIDYEQKKVVIIGSGATAVTLVPEMAKKASKVIMLQRSATYVLSIPKKDAIANFINKHLPTKIAYSLTRWKNILVGVIFYWFTQVFPNFMKKLLIKGVQQQVGANCDVEKHFTPTYNPWDQRLCFVPDNNLFKAIREGKAEIVTDHIKTFTEKGILLQSGKEVETDIIVTATGLKLQLAGNIALFVDGKEVEASQTIAYKSMMLSGVPNLALAFGYTNASWTLKVDLTNEYFCRLINYMDKHNYKQCMPVNRDKNLKLLPFLNFSSGYVQRDLHNLPKQGNRAPWLLKQNYIFDMYMLKYGKLRDNAVEFK